MRDERRIAKDQQVSFIASHLNLQPVFAAAKLNATRFISKLDGETGQSAKHLGGRQCVECPGLLLSSSRGQGFTFHIGRRLVLHRFFQCYEPCAHRPYISTFSGFNVCFSTLNSVREGERIGGSRP